MYFFLGGIGLLLLFVIGIKRIVKWRKISAKQDELDLATMEDTVIDLDEEIANKSINHKERYDALNKIKDEYNVR